MAARAWTQEQRERQAVLIRKWEPWHSSTGPRTEEGKRAVAQNAFKGSMRPKLRELNKDLGKLLDEAKELMGTIENPPV